LSIMTLVDRWLCENVIESALLRRPPQHPASVQKRATFWLCDGVYIATVGL
jgi:hypothetical protein